MDSRAAIKESHAYSHARYSCFTGTESTGRASGCVTAIAARPETRSIGRHRTRIGNSAAHNPVEDTRRPAQTRAVTMRAANASCESCESYMMRATRKTLTGLLLAVALLW